LEHEHSDDESDGDEDTEDEVVVENVVEGVDQSEPDWRQFAAVNRGFQLDTTQESLTSNLFTVVKANKGSVLFSVILLY